MGQSDDQALIQELCIMLLIGGQAAIIHFENSRPPLGWDVVATPGEVAMLRKRLPESLPGRTSLRFSLRGMRLEVSVREGRELWELADEHPAACGGTSDIPGLGEVDVASPGLLMVLKFSLLAYPVQYFKNLADFLFLRSQAVDLTHELVPVLHAAMAEAAELHSETVPPPELACLHRGEVVNDWAAHDAWHERLKLGDAPRCSHPDAWNGMTSLEASERGTALRELIAEETLVLAAEKRARCRPDDAADPHWHKWALRHLMTGELPLRLRYFAANHHDEILALVGGRLQRT